MSIETAALIVMGIIAAGALATLGLALWTTRHKNGQHSHKNALPTH